MPTPSSYLALLFAIVALILALGCLTVSVVLYRATKAARSSTPTEVLIRMAEIEQEWSSTLEGNARFMKKMSQRMKRDETAQIAPETTNVTPTGDKAALRALARQRGLHA